MKTPARKPSVRAAKEPVAKKTPARPATAAKPVVEAAATPAKPRAPRKKAATVIPEVLLQGDAPVPAPRGGPGERYALGPAPTPEHFTAMEAPGELPEAYGTQKLFLTARDPHWLYAHWDFTQAQLKKSNALSADGHLIVRVHANATGGKPLSETHVHPESRNWFIHVGRGGAKFVAELGCYGKKRKWQTLSTSAATLTPPDTMSDDTSARFATLPVEVSFEQIQSLVKAAARENAPLIEAIQQLRAAGHAALPKISVISGGQWTPAQERALAEIVTMDEVRRVWIGSLEITELVRRQLVKELSSAAAAQFSLPSSPLGGVSSLSSPFGGARADRSKNFWFNVNAELIIYGATEPDAEVSIGGRVIRLRADGTFSYRFALPDGNYDLPVVAVSADRTDGRAAELKFSRASNYRGEVGTHPQDPKLKAPRVENVA
ncbi:MAG: DUF4912 domain-containing protein [Verrucomicrobia bacterium]|nr:DUF4912 domain-containing protein [Verrucomicrobiota bacterium]